MTSITVGEGANAKSVTVSDEFLQLSPEQQQATANDIAKQLGINANAQAVASETPTGEKQWRRGALAPVEKQVDVDEKGKMTDTGEWRFAVPGLIVDTLASVERLMQPPPVVDPEHPQAIQGIDTLEQTKPGFTEDLTTSAMMGLSGIKAGKKPAVGEVVSETVENVGGGKITGGTFREGLPEAPAAKPDGTVKQTWTPDLIDQELDATLTRLNATKAKTVLGKPADKFKHKLGDKPEVLPKSVSGFPKASGVARFSMQQERAFKAEKTGDLTQEGGLGTPVGRISVPATATIGTVPQELKLRQASRFQTAAAYASREASETNIKNFQTQMENTLALEGNKLTPAAAEAFGISKNAIAQIDDMNSLNMFAQKLSEAANKTNKSSWMDKFLEVWINWGLLSGPQTHMANVLSNSVVNMFSLSEHALAAGLGKVTGSGLSFREAGARAVGDLEAVGDALFAAGKSFKSEKPLFETEKLDYNPMAIGGSKGKLARIPGRALTAEDAFFKTLAHRQEIVGLSVRKAMDEGLSGRALSNRIAELRTNPTDDMVKSAEQFAKKQTFTDGLGKHGRDIQAFLREKPWARLIVPFFRTPVKLLEYSIERTPAAFAMKKSRDDLFGRNGAVARDLAWTRMTMGSAIGLYVMYQAAQKNISGSGPSNENERKIWLSNGNQPYSVRIGGTWYSYGRMEPLGTLLGVAADAQNIYNEMGETEADDFAALVVASVSNNLANKTWLRGPVDFVQALYDARRYGESYASSMLGTVIPTGIAQYARTQDPYVREMRELIDGVKSRIPGERETLNMRLDPFGEPIKSEGGLGPDLISPIYTRAAKNDPTINEMLRLHAPPGRLSKEIEGVELSPDEWLMYGQTAGQLTKTYADALVNAPAYKDLPDAVKKTLLEDAIRKSRDTARSALKAQFPDLILRIAQKKAQERLGGTAPLVE